MTKQEFLAISLPKELMAVCEEDKEIKQFTIARYQMSDSGKYHYQPILHPLSALTKEIAHNGEKFIPIYKIFSPPVPIDQTQIANEVKSYNLYAVIKKNDVVVYKIKKDYNVIPFWIVQKLIEWHFDIAGLIEKGEAIDVNTLPENPYK